MSDKIKKIAAELAPKIRQAIANGVTDKFVEQDIQSAIEKATKQLKREAHLSDQAASDNSDWFDQLVSDCAELLGCKKNPVAILDTLKSRAAHASEHWTVGRIEAVMRDNPSTWKSALAFELNAKLEATAAMKEQA